MQTYKAKNGKQYVKPSIEEVHEMEANNEGWCLCCGNTQMAEPDAERYRCDACGEFRVYGVLDLMLRNLYH